MIVKFADYEQLTPAETDRIKKAFVSSPEYVEGIFAKRGAKEWAESVSGLSALLAAMTEAKIDPSTAVIKRLESGKPVFTNIPYYFNISHSIAENFFAPEEIKRFRSAKNSAEEFYRIWTRKEALLKKEGSGIEYKKLKNTDTFVYPDAEFIEYKRGQYLTTVCLGKKVNNL